MKHHFALLGYPVRDRVTGFVGVVSSISFDLYGCVQAIVTPPIGKDGKSSDSQWFDVKRLEATSRKPAMVAPNFTLPEIGAQAKPAYPSQRPIDGSIRAVSA